MNTASQQIILIISADQARSKVIHSCLEQAGYRVYETCKGRTVPDTLTKLHPHLVMLDWYLPDQNALAVTHTIRRNGQFARIPIILTGREISSENKIISLENGVDLCLDGAVYPKELVARVRALLRRVNLS